MEADAVTRYLDEIGISLLESPELAGFPPPDGPGDTTLLVLQETTSLFPVKPPFPTPTVEEKTPEVQNPDRVQLDFRSRAMAGKEAEYKASLEAYQAMYESPMDIHIEGLSNCRKFAMFVREKISGEVKVMSSACGDRWCPMCAAAKAAYATDQTEEYIRSLDKPRFLTLTLRHDPQDLKSQLNFLTDSFRRIRQRAFWKKNVTGGIWFLQAKRGSGTGCWHPHLHILIDGNYMEQKRLSDLWELVTFGSPVIDIRRIHDPAATARNVARYTARPASMADMSLADRIEVIESLKGKRLCGTFGNAKGVNLVRPKIKDGLEWQEIGYYDRVIMDETNNPTARTILFCYNNNKPLSEELFELYTGRPVNFTVPAMDEYAGKQLSLDFFNTS